MITAVVYRSVELVSICYMLVTFISEMACLSEVRLMSESSYRGGSESHEPVAESSDHLPAVEPDLQVRVHGRDGSEVHRRQGDLCFWVSRVLDSS
jgi:hypothetical protein